MRYVHSFNINFRYGHVYARTRSIDNGVCPYSSGVIICAAIKAGIINRVRLIKITVPFRVLRMYRDGVLSESISETLAVMRS